ncbi:MAG: hypothetical protein AB7O66_11615 [Limisphaerales bacterium]
MTFGLEKIPGVDAKDETVWMVRAMSSDGRCPVLSKLREWMHERPQDYRAIMKVLRLAAGQKQVRNQKHVKRSENPADGKVYEALAYSLVARVMFFYDDRRTSKYLICVVPYEKGRGDQSSVFRQCANLRDLYLASS